MQKFFLDFMNKGQKTNKQAALQTQLEKTVMLSQSKDQFVAVKPKTIKELINDKKPNSQCCSCDFFCFCFCKEGNLESCSDCIV